MTKINEALVKYEKEMSVFFEGANPVDRVFIIGRDENIFEPKIGDVFSVFRGDDNRLYPRENKGAPISNAEIIIKKSSNNKTWHTSRIRKKEDWKKNIDFNQTPWEDQAGTGEALHLNVLSGYIGNINDVNVLLRLNLSPYLLSYFKAKGIIDGFPASKLPKNPPEPLNEDAVAKEVKSQAAEMADPAWDGNPSYTIEFTDDTAIVLLFDREIAADKEPAYRYLVTDQYADVTDWEDFETAEKLFDKLKSSVKISLDPKAVKLFVTAAKKRSSK